MITKRPRGRPTLDIDIERYKAMRAAKATWPEIEQALGCSRATILNRLAACQQIVRVG